MTTMPPPTFAMTVDLNVLEHLGINLYSNIAAVLTEAVANAWDADAENVAIHVDLDDKCITIEDDGVGMSADEMNNKYLRVGYRRREDGGSVTAKNRPVMGRKGVGKLSLFSVANIIEVQSAKNGKNAGFQMSVDGIKQAIDKNETYHPTSLDDHDVTVRSGTRITLHDIKRQRLNTGIEALRKRLARRFSIIGESHGFNITINGEPITTADRDDLAKVEFLWTFEGDDPDPEAIGHVAKHKVIDARLDSWEPTWRINGWVGTAHLPGELNNPEMGNLNGLVVFARGRLFQENILEKLNHGGVFTKYLTGQIEADFLDVDEEPDIATSDRQRMQEDDPRYAELIKFLRRTIAEVEKVWSAWRGKREVQGLKEKYPRLKAWFDNLGEGHRENAEVLFGRLSTLTIDDDKDRMELYRHGILAFERMRLRDATAELADHALDIDRLFVILGDRDALEASLYRDIVRSRLEVIRKFREIVDEDTKEAVLQQYLFDHLWLLDPAWERATEDAFIESRLINKDAIVNDLSEKEKLSRVDIKYRTITGKHVIVELKRAGKKVDLIDLQRQGRTYVDKLEKILLAQNVSNPNIEVVFVLGKPVEEEEQGRWDRIKSAMNFVSAGSQIVHYDTLIQRAHSAYDEYLKKSLEFDEIDKLVESLR